MVTRVSQNGSIVASVSIKGGGKGKGQPNPIWTPYMTALVHESDLQGDTETEAHTGHSRTMLVGSRAHPGVGQVITEYEVTASLNANSEQLVVNVTEHAEVYGDSGTSVATPDDLPDLGPDDSEDRGNEGNPNMVS